MLEEYKIYTGWHMVLVSSYNDNFPARFRDDKCNISVIKYVGLIICILPSADSSFIDRHLCLQ